MKSIKVLFLIFLSLFSCTKDKSISILSETIFYNTDTTTSLVWNAEDLLNCPLSYDSIRCNLRSQKLIDYIIVINHYVPVAVNWECNRHPSEMCLRRRNVIEVSFDSVGVMINRQHFMINELDSIFQLAYTNNGLNSSFPTSPQSSLFNIDAKYASSYLFEMVILELVQAYTNVVSEEIKASLDRCLFYKDNKTELRKKFPFKLYVQTQNRSIVIGDVSPAWLLLKEM